MKLKKALITLSTAVTTAMLTSMPVSVSAKVIEPVITHTENWTASYYIDDDKDTLYPYIEVQADIYSNGNVEVSFWNTHEWDDYANIIHTVTMPYSVPYAIDSKEYAFSKGEWYASKESTDTQIWYYPYTDSETYIPDFSVPLEINQFFDISFYPEDDYYNNGLGCYDNGFDTSTSIEDVLPVEFRSVALDKNNIPDFSATPSSIGWYGWTGKISYFGYKYNGSLGTLPINRKQKFTFTTSKNITKDYQFHILGHDFTVSPEMLVTEKGDVNCDGAVGVSDVVLLQKWILNSPDAKLINWRTADLNNDEEINVYDLVLLRRKLIEVH